MKILAQFLVPIGCPIAGILISGIALNPAPSLAATLTFQAATAGVLTFHSQGNQVGSGSFTYSSEPIAGTFVNLPRRFLFVPASDPIPEGLFPISTISISADQNFRLVNRINLQISGANFSYSQSDLPAGEFFNDILLFQPPESSVFPPGPGGPFEIATGDPRSPGLWSSDRWFLGDKGGVPRQQLVLWGDGSFSGFDLSQVGVNPTLGGAWKAEAVPEPMTILGWATAAGLGAAWKRQRTKSSRSQPATKAKV